MSVHLFHCQVYWTYAVAVLIGRVTGLARPSVGMSVCFLI